MRLWDPTTGQQHGNPLTGHTHEVTSVAFGALPDGTTLLATASTDYTVRLWDPTTGQPLGQPLTGHTGWVTAVAFGALPDGTTLLATASRDATVRLWDPTTGKRVAWDATLFSGQEIVVRHMPSGEIKGVTPGAWRYINWWVPQEDGTHVMLPAETYGPLPPLLVQQFSGS